MKTKKSTNIMQLFVLYLPLHQYFVLSRQLETDTIQSYIVIVYKSVICTFSA